MKIIATDDGGMDVLAFNVPQKAFTRELHYLTDIMFGKGDFQNLTEDEFNSLIQKKLVG